MVLTYRPNKSEYFWISFSEALKNKTLWLVEAIAFIPLLFSSISDALKSDFKGYLLFIYMFFLFIFSAIPILLFILIVLILIILFRLIRSSFIFNEEIRFSFNRNGYVSQTSRSKSEIKWSFVKQVKQRKNYFIFVMDAPGSSPLILPKRAFVQPKDLQSFLTVLKERGLIK